MSGSGMALGPRPPTPGERRQRPPSETFSETMSKLRFPSRRQVLRDYLPDDRAVVPEAEAQAWRDAPAMVNAREHLDNEAQWLSGAAPLSTGQRWALLCDLRSRLDELSHHLRENAVPAALYSTLTALAATIDSTGDVDRIWHDAVSVLNDFVAQADSAIRSTVSLTGPTPPSARKSPRERSSP
jgi:hypothetical protein